MNKSAIATAIALAAVSGTASAYQVVDNGDTQMAVGGYAEARYQMSEGNDNNADYNRETSRARINLVGEQVIEDGLKAFGKFEIEVSGNDDQTNRAAFAGIKGDFGALSFGRNELTEGLVNARNLSDIQAEGVIDARAVPTALSGWAGAQMTYSYNSDMVDFAAVYAFEDEGETEDNQGQSYSASAKIKTSAGITLGVGYGAGEYYTDPAAKTGLQEEDVLYVGAQYKVDAFTLGATYHDMGDDLDRNGYEVVARYDMEKTTLTLAYMNQENELASEKEVQDAVVLSGMYHFSPNLLAHASIASDSADGATYEQHTRFALKYSF